MTEINSAEIFDMNGNPAVSSMNQKLPEPLIAPGTSTGYSGENRRYNGGGGNMKDDYVTHEELNHAVDKLSDKIDLLGAHIDARFESVNTKFESVNTKFEKQKVWFYATGISIILATIAIVKFIR